MRATIFNRVRCVVAAFVLVVGLLLVMGCDDGCFDPKQPNERDMPPSEDATSDTLVIGDQAFVLTCSLWRDFQPVSPPGGKPMIGVVVLREVDSQPIEGDLELTHLWVIYGELYWSTEYTSEVIPDVPEYMRVRIARDGPKWGPDITVDVVSEVTDRNGRAYYIRERDVYVFATY